MNIPVRFLAAGMLLTVLAVGTTRAGEVTIPNNFTANTPAVAAQVNANFGAVASGVNDNDGRIAALEAQVAALQSALAAVQNNTVLALDGKLGLVDDPATVGQPTARFQAVNVQIVNGSDETATTNGVGNLIVGYNEHAGFKTFCSDGTYDNQTNCENNQAIWAVNQRSGSHNLIVGDYNAYSRYGGLLAGRQNIVNGPWASVSGGINNTASGLAASVSGGIANTSSGIRASVSGGQSNIASGDDAWVSGGNFNTASGPLASVSGGRSNNAPGTYASVSGGDSNTASGQRASVSGGRGNTASGSYSTVGGGLERSATGHDDWAAGNLSETQ